MQIKNSILAAVACCLSLCTKAQPQMLVDKNVYEFGAVAWRKPVSATFTLTNKGNKPLVISHVSTSCGCTAVKWEQAPIAPGKSGNVTATFDAATLGHFDKMVGVYCNASDLPVYLRLRGDVVSEVKDYSGTYPYTIGALRLNSDSLVFTDVRKGEKPVAELAVINTAKSRYTPVVMQMPGFLTLESLPPRITGTRKGTLRFTLDSGKLGEPGLTETTMYLARFEGDKVDEKNAIHVSVLMLPDIKDQDPVLAPRIEVSDTTMEFGRLTKSRRTRMVELGNAGQSPLKIERIQLFSTALTVSIGSKTIEQGKKEKLKVTVAKELLKKGESPVILLITNDPRRPKIYIKVNVSL